MRQVSVSVCIVQLNLINAQVKIVVLSAYMLDYATANGNS